MKDDRFYLQHILDAIEKVEAYTRCGREAFMSESQWHDATLRQLEIIGEAAKHLSPAFREAHGAIPWRRIAGLRDVLIHEYFGVDLPAVWELTQTDIPELKPRIALILGQTGSP
jgi:uncharacterized protein with HEPN domain